MMAQQQKCRVGQARPSQLLYSFGVGSLVDLPTFSVTIMGLDDWPDVYAPEVAEERLLAAVRRELDADVERLLSPPRLDEPRVGPPRPFDESQRVGVPVATFPRWFFCPQCRRLAPLQSELFTFKPDPFRPDRAGYVHENCSHGSVKKPTVIPARFLVACERGHLDDFPWVTYVHRGPTTCRSRLRIKERGLSGEAASVYVECETCDIGRSMAEAFDDETHQAVGACTGRRPHLRDYEDEECDQEARPILLGASNSWFPIILTALSVPTDVDKLGQLVTEHWPVLGMTTSPEMVPLVRTVGKLHAFVRYTDEEIWQAIERKRAGGEDEKDEHEDLRGPEWDVFISADPQRNTTDFKLRPVASPEGFENLIEQVVLVERVREVNALVGFTRIESPGDFSEFADIPEERRAPLSRRSPTWVPASEVRGEGIFLRFSEGAIQRWVYQIPSLVRAREFREAHGHWRRMRELRDTDESFPGMRYILLHSFSHALMRQLALECGYTSASIRERLYAREPQREGEPMAGILLYTAAPDSEGTLGGLVRLGEPDQLRGHVTQALERLHLCASDPLCAEHKPADGGTSVHGAACHACLFVPETSCERGNRYLDRAVLAPTFADDGIAFFGALAAGSPG